MYVAQKVQDNRFKIAGGKPGMEVSWMVTGTRHDVYAEQHRTPVEQDKSPQDKGKYLTPKECGQPESNGISYDRLHQLDRTTPSGGK